MSLFFHSPFLFEKACFPVFFLIMIQYDEDSYSAAALSFTDFWSQCSHAGIQKTAESFLKTIPFIRLLPS